MTSGPNSLWLLAGLSAALMACGSSVQSEPAEVRGRTMGTTYAVTYAPTLRPAEESREIAGLLSEISQSLSTYIETSLISRINASGDPDTWHPVDTHFRTVFEAARTVYDDTDGAFNPAVAPLVNAWGFGPDGPGRSPDAEDIASLLDLVSFEAFELGPDGVRKRLPGAQLDFSAIAKGYGVDAVAGLLEDWGVDAYFVEIGGEVRTRGRHPIERRPWRVGIETPSTTAQSPPRIRSVVSLNDGALATSGSYRNYIVQDGTRIAHILDPRSGYPESHSLLSVSVLAEDAMTADAYATAFMVMGVQGALRFVDTHDGLEAYFISSDESGNLVETFSSGFPKP